MTGFHIIIPARMASTRLPGKMLADLNGAPLIVRTAQQASRANALSVTVATDHDSILDAVNAANFKCVMTDTAHTTGTDRLAQAAHILQLADDALVVNVQGDEPLIDPKIIQAVAHQLASNPNCAIATAAHMITSPDDIFNPNVVKVVCNAAQDALYFSRAPIPYLRDGYAQNASGLMQAAFKHGVTAPPVYRHLGIYAYRVSFLKAFPSLSASPLEGIESLEQLRALWHGYRISVLPWDKPLESGVDTEADLIKVRRHFLQ